MNTSTCKMHQPELNHGGQSNRPITTQKTQHLEHQSPHVSGGRCAQIPTHASTHCCGRDELQTRLVFVAQPESRTPDPTSALRRFQPSFGCRRPRGWRGSVPPSSFLAGQGTPGSPVFMSSGESFLLEARFQGARCLFTSPFERKLQLPVF